MVWSTQLVHFGSSVLRSGHSDEFGSGSGAEGTKPDPSAAAIRLSKC